MRVFLRINVKNPRIEQVEKGMMGGSGLLFYLIRDFLESKGCDVDIWPNDPFGEYDLAIHCDRYDDTIKSKKSIIWGGSWSSAYDPRPDVKIVVTQYMKDNIKGWDDALVIPAPFNREILEWKTERYVEGKIFCNANPNRYYREMLTIAEGLRKRMVDFHWLFSSGNQLYSDKYPELFHLGAPVDKVSWVGVLERNQLFKTMANAQIWAYPGFNQKAETQCVSMLEAMALGIPTVLPAQEPFIEVAKRINPQPYLCADLGSFEYTLCKLLDGGPYRIHYDVDYYRSDRIMEQWWTVIKDLHDGKVFLGSWEHYFKGKEKG